MTRTITVDTGEELKAFIECIVASGKYKTNSEVVREGLRLLMEKQAASKIELLKRLIQQGDDSGEDITWDINEFLAQST